MNIKRIGRALICLLLIFCLILNIAPPKAEATGAGLAGTFTAVSGVTVSAPLAIGAAAIALGVMAKNTNPLVFENMVNDAVASLSAAGEWVKDGTVELLQTIDSAGQKAYYVAGDMLEDMRSWLLSSPADSPYVSCSAAFFGTEITFPDDNFSIIFSSPVYLVCHYIHGPSSAYFTGLNYKYFAISSVPFSYHTSTSSVQSHSTDFGGYYISTIKSGNGGKLTPVSGAHYVYYGQVDDIIQSSYMTDVPLGLPSDTIVSTDYDLTLGSIPYAGAFTDGSSALEWAEEYARKALKVIEGGNDPDPDSQPPNDGKWFWPLALGLTVGVLGSMSQADEWSGQTPAEFSEYTTSTDYEILSHPEVEVGTGIEIAPASSPDSGGDSGSSGDTGSDGDSDSTGTDETTWFQRIVTGIEELPSKFQNWITDCKTAIEELPSKFADWFNKIIEILGNIWEWLQNLVSSLIDALKQLLVDLFAPSAEFIANKVNALCAKYPYLDTFLALGTDLKAYFLSLGTKPPIIYIDLGASRGSLPLGGRQAFIDLTWYAEYKPTMDAILGAFLWLWLAWRLFLSLPGLIQGFSGTYGSKNIEYERLPNMPKYQFGSNWLNSGSSYHKTGDWHHRDKVK